MSAPTIERPRWLEFAPLLLLANVGMAAIATTSPASSPGEGRAGIRGVVNRHPEQLIGLTEATSPRATVSVIGSSGTRTVDTNDGGEFSFDNLTSGVYRLEFKKKTSAWSVERVLVCPRMISIVETRDPRTHSRFEGERMGGHLPSPSPPAGYLRSQQGSAGIVGQIRTPDQQGIAGAHLSAERVSDHSKFITTTDDTGGYLFANLAAGDYRVTISGSSVISDRIPGVTVLDGLLYRLDREVCRRSD